MTTYIFVWNSFQKKKIRREAIANKVQLTNETFSGGSILRLNREKNDKVICNIQRLQASNNI